MIRYSFSKLLVFGIILVYYWLYHLNKILCQHNVIFSAEYLDFCRSLFFLCPRISVKSVHIHNSFVNSCRVRNLYKDLLKVIVEGIPYLNKRRRKGTHKNERKNDRPDEF